LSDPVGKTLYHYMTDKYCCINHNYELHIIIQHNAAILMQFKCLDQPATIGLATNRKPHTSWCMYRS